MLSEPGSGRAAPLLQGGLLSTVNLSEVHLRLVRRGSSSDFAWAGILRLGCTFCLFTEDHARVASELMAVTKPHGLSLGDRACLALAMERNATVYTADQAWQRLSLRIRVELIR